MQLDRIEDSIQFIRARPKPLAIYAFTENVTLQKRLISETSSGSIMMNDAILQVVFQLVKHNSSSSIKLVNFTLLNICSVLWIHYLLAELEGAGSEDTMGNIHLIISVTRRWLF